MTQKFAITIPAYQAAETVGDVVRRAREHAGEVLVVDDGSTDATHTAAERAGARVLRHVTNRGKGAALLTAFDDLFTLGFGAVVTLDADGQHLPEETPKLIEAWREGADLVLGCRFDLFRGMAAHRKMSNTISSTLISAVAGTNLADVQCGFRLYTRRLLETTGFPEPRFEAESAVVVRAVRAGMRIATVPIRLGFVDGRRTSHYRPILDSFRIAGAVARARMEAPGWADRRSS